jgi:hypothetical protein
MAEPRGRVAWDAIQRTQRHAASATPVELALIGAPAKCYPSGAGLGPVNLASPLTAYADAMKDVAARFPDDADVADEYQPLEALGTGRNADARDGGNRRTTISTRSEASPHAGRAIPAAQRVAATMPVAGHLVYMPAHIWQRVGRFAEAARPTKRERRLFPNTIRGQNRLTTTP